MSSIMDLLKEHQNKYQDCFYLVPSENSLPTVARIPFLLDSYARYFFNIDKTTENWAFHGGRIIEKIENNYLIPILRKLTKGTYVNVRPISGLNCMTMVLLSYCKNNDNVLILPAELGGHASTKHVVKKLGFNPIFMPYDSLFKIDEEKLKLFLKENKIKLIYIDQSNVLFPIDVQKIATLRTEFSPLTKIHYDTSHINALVLGRQLRNPFDEGADSFGGSTHKTIPGPHKAFFVTNNPKINDSLMETTNYFISHHHMAEIASLAIVLEQFASGKGEIYAQQMVKNANCFASVLDHFGIKMFSKGNEYTRTHQLWVDPKNFFNPLIRTEDLYRVGLIVNCFSTLPTINTPCFRIGLNEATFLGVKEDEVIKIANYFLEVVFNLRSKELIQKDVKKLRHQFDISPYFENTECIKHCEEVFHDYFRN